MSTHETSVFEKMEYKPKDMGSDQEVRWCPGCGDYAILTQVRKVLAKQGRPKDQIAFVSGIGCSSRFPYYLDTYGMHSIHGRAPAVATGLKSVLPDMQTWVVTGDGDGLSIGGNHLMHALRRNVGLKILLFNNRIYGLTKGQYSPTSEQGKKTKTTPDGSLDYPVKPLSIALGAEATFVARTVDTNVKHMVQVFERAAAHEGSCFIEIYQDCNVYNHKAFDYAAEKKLRDDHTVVLEHGQPLVFGKEVKKGIRLKGLTPEVVTLGDGVDESQLLVHDEHAEDTTYAFLLAQMMQPEMPEPIGVFRDVSHAPFERLMAQRIARAKEARPDTSLEKLFNAGETWTVT